MAQTTRLVTGFPGFIAARLVTALEKARPSKWILLAEPRFVEAATAKMKVIEAEIPTVAGRWAVVAGDIRKADLGLTDSDAKKLRAEVTEVWHLAAIYDLAVPASLAYQVNVDGTLHVLDLCETLPKLGRLLYISTCYVAGDRVGRILESELDEGQGFKNHYESTKAWAEKLVRNRSRKIPTVIFRPSIVVGDSQTGETAKGDGPYFVMQLLMRLPKALPMVNLGQMKAPVNVVPVDWLVDAMVLLAAEPAAVGQTFQLADPHPVGAKDALALMIDALGRAPVVGTVPWAIVGPLVKRPRVAKLLRMPSEAFDYFHHHVEYDTTNTDKLLAGRLPCPPLASYLPVLINYALDNPKIFKPKG